MGRLAILVYGGVCYLLFLETFLYAVGFIGGFVVVKDIDTPLAGAPAVTTAQAALINVLLLGLFGVQHSIMARRGFKEHWTKLVPPPIERSTFVLFTCIVLNLMFWQWRAMPAVVWQLDAPAAVWAFRILYFVGIGLVFYATILIDHFDLFGLRQVVLHWQRKQYTHPHFAMPTLYRVVRHPLYLGFMIAFWSASTMTQGRLLFAIVASAYMLAAIQLEERDLAAIHGEDYRRYKSRVSMILPIPRRNPALATQPVGRNSEPQTDRFSS